MKYLFFYTFLLLISCSEFDSNIVGIWIQNDSLFDLESKKIDRPMGNLSQAFGEIKLVFKNDLTFKAHFDNQTNSGKWKIKNDSIYMTQYNNETIWNSFEYKLVDNELYIYSDPWLMALKKQN